MRISDWSSDVCSSDLPQPRRPEPRSHAGAAAAGAGKRLSHHSAEGERPMSLGTPPPATAPRGGNHRLALAGLLVGIAALAALAAAGLGYRLGWWPLGTAFVLAQVGAYGAVLACAQIGRASCRDRVCRYV